MGSMPHDFTLTVIVVAFVLVAIAVVLGVLVMLGDTVAPLLSRITRGVDWRDWLSDRLPHRHADDRDDDEDDDDLDDEAAALLAMISDAPIVVDSTGEVLRASPEAARLGIVNDDTITDDRVAAAVRAVQEHGGRQHLDITTATPPAFAHDEGVAVSRPNWVKVTVGRINAHLVVVLLADVSETVRFNQVRDDFITNVSEQLLRPSEELAHLAERLEHGDAAQVRQDARNVRRTIGYVNHMVRDLLLLIKAQEQVVPSGDNQLALLAEVESAAGLVQERASAHGQQVKVSGDASLTVHGDASQIRAAIGKLLENALDYSPQGATVSVTVGRSPDGHDAVIRVIDRGTGIPEREQDRIFERFYRGSRQNERTGEGVGLGLAIVKHVALTHHGGVNVWSRPGQGSTFSLVLPLGDSLAEAPVVPAVEMLPDEHGQAEDDAEAADDRRPLEPLDVPQQP